jgi:hypothetical protein
MPIDPEDMLADWEQRVEQQVALTTELSQAMEQSSASAESRGGEVFVKVGSSGGLTDLRIADRAMSSLSAAELASLIVETSRRAQASLAEQVNELVGRLYGPSSETASFVGGAYTRQFPEPADDEERERR